jgi:hypothetical protein
MFTTYKKNQPVAPAVHVTPRELGVLLQSTLPVPDGAFTVYCEIFTSHFPTEPQFKDDVVGLYFVLVVPLKSSKVMLVNWAIPGFLVQYEASTP